MPRSDATILVRKRKSLENQIAKIQELLASKEKQLWELKEVMIERGGPYKNKRVNQRYGREYFED